MRVALVHDYLNVYGGAERVLSALCELFSEAPIYTSFLVRGSECDSVFGDREIVESFAAKIPGFSSRLHSPMRFLIPLIWESFDLSDYDVVISSSSSFMSKGVMTGVDTLHVSYVHTPPRNLYGYDTDFSLQHYLPVKIYAGLVNKRLRMFDYLSSQRVDVFVANSKEVAGRIRKYYRREANVVHPPVDVPKKLGNLTSADKSYFLTGGRLVGIKHFDVIVEACTKAGLPLKVYGTGPREETLRSMAGETVEFVGRVDDEQLSQLYFGAFAYVTMATDEDFGITPVEAQAHGTPVICYRGGGYVETVVEGKTGVFVDTLDVGELVEILKTFDPTNYKKSVLLTQAKAFSKERFLEQMSELVQREYEKLEKRHA